MRTLVTLITLNLVVFALDAQELTLVDGWKFSEGDNLNWAKPGYDDSKWQPIKVNQEWELQGHKGYDGFAWYRIKVFIPSSIKNNATVKDLVNFDFATVDNYNQSYLNGSLIGQNSITVQDKAPKEAFNEGNVAWNSPRIYTLCTDDKRILWDKENIIAVRVFDSGGNGGIGMGVPRIFMVDVPNYIKLNVKDFPYQVDSKNNRATKSISISNSSSVHTFVGKLHIACKDAFYKMTQLDTTILVAVDANTFKDVSFSLKTHDYEILSIQYDFTEDKSNHVFSEKEYVPYLLTPVESDRIKINNPLIVGVRPLHPFTMRIAVTGPKPFQYKIYNLPKELEFDSVTGTITGVFKEKGEHTIRIYVSGKTPSGKPVADEKEIRIKVGDDIALTPPMGWNSYYSFWNEVTEDQIRKTARLLKETDLIDHGYVYCNIDDGWAGKRDSKGNILPNDKFRDMKNLGGYIHQQGLKYGIYSSPGIRTCGIFTGSYQHELQDAKTYGSWGVDYLKYDWCSYADFADPKNIDDLQRPYILMRHALDSVKRDIVYSLCQYGMGDVWKWGRKVGGDLWRTTFDINDAWGSLRHIGFQQDKFSAFSSPSGWNDPDMLQIGWFRGGRSLHPSNLTVPEQYSQFTLWSLLSAPLILSCDLTQYDNLMQNLLTNDEVIAIDQDVLGKSATKVYDVNNFHIYKKDLVDGTQAIGIFNLTERDTVFQFNFAEAGLNQFIQLRDLWEQKNIGTRNGHTDVLLPSHGCALFKVAPSTKLALRSYHENWVRYLMADIILGDAKNYYRKYADDGNSQEALRRIAKDISITNLNLFERKPIKGKGMRIVRRGTMETISGNEIKLSTDGLLNEVEVRAAMLALSQGNDVSEIRKRYPAEVKEALFRDSVGVKIINDYVNHSSTNSKNQADKQVMLSSDVDYDEDIVCYMLADIALGGEVNYYKEIFDAWRDPNAGEAVRRWNSGVKVSNLKDFDRVDLPGQGIKIVWKGTSKVITGTEIKI